MSNLSSLSVLFIPCWWDGLPRNSGSARIRAEWVCRNWDGAQVYDSSQSLAGHDLYVFQKAYLSNKTRGWIKTVAGWRDMGKCRLIFDLCDPDFLGEEHRRRMLSVLPMFDFAVATTNLIADWLKQWVPVYVIPDRVDLAALREMGLQAKEPTQADRPRLVWAGYESNLAALDVLRPTIEELALSLEIIAVDRPRPFVEFWSDILQYDMLLNPRPDRPPFSYKSDNKTLIAWALGMPVARTPAGLTALVDPGARRSEVEARSTEVFERWDIMLSVLQWQKLGRIWRYELPG